MTVKTTYSYEEFQGNDVATSFPFDFPFFKKNDITVTEIDPDANEKVLVYGQDYEIPGVRWYNGGQIDLIRPSPLPTGYKLLVERIVDETQEFAVRNTGNFNPSSHEDAYDKLTMIIQQTVFSHSKALQLNKSRTEWQTRGLPFDQLTSNSHVKGQTSEFTSMNVTDSATIQQLTVDTINVDLVNVENQTVTNQTVKHLNVTDDATIKNIDIEGGDLDVDNISVAKLTATEETKVTGLKLFGPADVNQQHLINLPVPVRDDEPLRKGDFIEPGSGPSFQYVDDRADQAANAGDSLVSSGLIYPIEDGVSVQNGNELINITYVKASGGDFQSLSQFLIIGKNGATGPFTGTITNINLTKTPYYSASIDGSEVFLLPNVKVTDKEISLDNIGIENSDDISLIMESLSKYPMINKITSGIVSNVVISVSWQINRDNLTIILPVVSWIGDYDLYGGQSTNRQVGIITVKGSRETTGSLITSSIEDGTSVYTVDSADIFNEGDFVAIIGGPALNYLTRISEINGLNLTLDYTAGWDTAENTASLYPVTPVRNVNIYIDKIIDNSGSTIPEHQVTGVTYLDTFGGNVEIKQSYKMANPSLLTNRAHSLKAPYMDSYKPRFSDAGRGYTVQFANSLFCHAGLAKGQLTRHVIDWTRCAYCTLEESSSNKSNQRSVTTHGAYEHDITIKRVYTSKECQGTLSIANSGVSFGERTKRFKITESCIINGDFDTQNAEDVEVTGAKVMQSDFTRVNSSISLTDCDFSKCTSFRVRSRQDRDQLSVEIDKGKYPDIELQGFSGTIRASNSVMKWFENIDTNNIPSRIKTDNCRHSIDKPALLSVDNELSLTSPVITVPSTSSSIGVIVEGKKLHITTASCENSPVISLDGANAKSMIINGLDDVDPNAARTAAIIRSRNSNGLTANISGVNIEYNGTGPAVEFGRADVSNLKLVMMGNVINGEMKITQFGSVVKSTIVGNMVKDLTDLPLDDENNGVSSNIQL